MSIEDLKVLFRKMEHDIAQRIMTMAYSYVPGMKVSECIEEIKHDMTAAFQEMVK